MKFLWTIFLKLILFIIFHIDAIMAVSASPAAQLSQQTGYQISWNKPEKKSRLLMYEKNFYQSREKFLKTHKSVHEQLWDWKQSTCKFCTTMNGDEFLKVLVILIGRIASIKNLEFTDRIK